MVTALSGVWPSNMRPWTDLLAWNASLWAACATAPHVRTARTSQQRTRRSTNRTQPTMRHPSPCASSIARSSSAQQPQTRAPGLRATTQCSSACRAARARLQSCPRGSEPHRARRPGGAPSTSIRHSSRSMRPCALCRSRTADTSVSCHGSAARPTGWQEAARAPAANGRGWSATHLLVALHILHRRVPPRLPPRPSTTSPRGAVRRGTCGIAARGRPRKHTHAPPSATAIAQRFARACGGHGRTRGALVARSGNAR